MAKVTIRDCPDCEERGGPNWEGECDQCKGSKWVTSSQSTFGGTGATTGFGVTRGKVQCIACSGTGRRIYTCKKCKGNGKYKHTEYTKEESAKMAADWDAERSGERMCCLGCLGTIVVIAIALLFPDAWDNFWGVVSEWMKIVHDTFSSWIDA